MLRRRIRCWLELGFTGLAYAAKGRAADDLVIEITFRLNLLSKPVEITKVRDRLSKQGFLFPAAS